MYYHIGYEDVDISEAIDLICTLPPGALYVTCTHPEKSWSEAHELTADIIDKMTELVFALCGQTGAPRVVRPSDVVATQKARARAASAREKLEQNNWSDTERG